MSTKKDWKIMVYLAGDNNLSESMVNAITGMKENLGLNNNIALYAYFDSNVPGYPSVLFDFSKKDDSKFAQVCPEITSLGREIRTSAASIYKFVQWCTEDKPTADKHALIVSGHGDAFQKGNFLKDSGDDSYVSVRGLSKVLGGLKDDGRFGEKNLSVMGFDSCVMSSIEIAHQFQPFVDHMVSSQGLIPDRGWNYGGMLRMMDRLYNSGGGPNGYEISPAELCRIISESFIESNRDYNSFSARSVDIASCDLSKLNEHPDGDETVDGVFDAINRLGNALEIGLTKSEPAIQKRISNAILTSHWNCQTFLYDQCADIKDFASELQNEFADDASKESETVRDICKACEDTLIAVDRCVSSMNLGAEYQWSNGLSVYFPWSFFSYKLTRKQYREFDFALGRRRYEILPRERDERTKEHWEALRESKSPWLSFLDAYLYKTLKSVRNSGGDAYILGLRRDDILGEPKGLLMAEFHPHKVNDPYDKVNDPYDKVNDPYDKVNDPYDRLNAQQWENFRRFKNFPWAPKEWMPPKSWSDGTEDSGHGSGAAGGS